MIITTPCPMILRHWIRSPRLTKTVSLRLRRFWKTASFCGFILQEHKVLVFSNIFLFRKSTIPSKSGKDTSVHSCLSTTHYANALCSCAIRCNICRIPNGNIRTVLLKFANRAVSQSLNKVHSLSLTDIMSG